MVYIFSELLKGEQLRCSDLVKVTWKSLLEQGPGMFFSIGLVIMDEAEREVCAPVRSRQQQNTGTWHK